MNGLNFKLKLISRENKEGKYTYQYLLELLGYKENLQKKLVKIENFNNEKAIPIFRKNIKLVLRKMTNKNVAKLLTIIYTDKDILDVVKDNIELVLEKISKLKDNTTTKFLKENHTFLKTLKKEYGDSFIENYFDKILEYLPKCNLINDKDILKGISEELDLKLNKYMQENKLEIARGLLCTDRIDGISEETKKEMADVYAKTIKSIMEELIPQKAINEKETIDWWLSISKIGEGAYNDVYGIGSKVLKIGGIRETYFIPNHRRILQPIARFPLLLKDEKTTYAYVEVAERVKKLTREECREEEFYRIYEELRESGIIWIDFRIANLGKLTKENTQIHKLKNGDVINVDPQSVGLKGNMTGRALGEGETVIIDTDGFFMEKNKNSIFNYTTYSRKFEKRWILEQQAKAGNTKNTGTNKEKDDKGRED